MLHSVRYLQSQWNARSPELTLKDLVDLIRPGSSLALIERARRHYQACRFQCFVRSVAVAVDGPMPTTGALAFGDVGSPDFVVGSVRPCLALSPADLAAASSRSTSSQELEVQVLGALKAGLLVYVAATALQSELVERLRVVAMIHHFPVLGVTLAGDFSKDAPHPLALREVVVRVAPRGEPASSAGIPTRFRDVH
jgi:hypothetical protein